MVAVVATDTVPPVTIPVELPTEATVLLLLVHVPPDIVLLNIVVCPEHTVGVPVLAGGTGFTVITVVIGQPVR
jgi:hypothetical protein